MVLELADNMQKKKKKEPQHIPYTLTKNGSYT